MNVIMDLQTIQTTGVLPNSLILGDCVEIMPHILGGSVDLILCDLPYGRTNNKWDACIPFEILWDNYKRLLKPNGVAALFCDGLFMADLMVSNRKMWKYNLIWDKVLTSGFLNANKQPLRSHEEVVIFYKKQPTYNPQKTKGAVNHSKGTMQKKSEATNYNDYNLVDNRLELGDMKHPKSICTFSKPHPSTMLHPTQKSLEFCEWLIRTYTNEGDLVLDNTMGSGTTCLAAKNMSRCYIGIEKEQKYFDIACERISAVG